MLSPHIQPGTHVIGLKATPIEIHVTPEYQAAALLVEPSHHEGLIFTVARIRQCIAALSGFAVVFNEIDGWWPLEDYKPLDLPKCFKELLNVQPHDKDELVYA